MKKLEAKKKPKKQPSSSSSSDSEDDEPEFLGQMAAFLGEDPEDQIAYLKKTLFEGTDDAFEIVDKHKQVDMLLAIVLVSESLINKSTEDEPGFKFFTGQIGQIRNLMKRFFKALQINFKVPGPSQHLKGPEHTFFMVEVLESLIYMILDFSINQT